MKPTFSLVAVVLSCNVFLFGQAASLLTQQKPRVPADWSPRAATLGPIEVLSDTQSVDFGPYFQRVLHDVQRSWYGLIPESARAPIMRKGRVSIELAIQKDGHLKGMSMPAGGSSGDVSLDRAAWGAIVASAPFPPLPTQFTGDHLALRMHFYYNPGPGEESGIPQSPKSGVTVTIFPRPSIDVPVGGTQVVSATVKGSTNTAVRWSVTGPGCSGSACGSVSGGLYLAPRAAPRASTVTLVATSEADPDASDFITVHIGPAPRLFPRAQ
jgi:hypothetical protein